MQQTGHADADVRGSARLEDGLRRFVKGHPSKGHPKPPRGIRELMRRSTTCPENSELMNRQHAPKKKEAFEFLLQNVQRLNFQGAWEGYMKGSEKPELSFLQAFGGEKGFRTQKGECCVGS